MAHACVCVGGEGEEKITIQFALARYHGADAVICVHGQYPEDLNRHRLVVRNPEPDVRKPFDHLSPNDLVSSLPRSAAILLGIVASS